MYGGIESALGSLARLRPTVRQFDFEFGLCFSGRHRNELLASGCVVHDLPNVRLSRPWTVWKARRRLKQILDSTHAAVVIVHGSWMYAIAAPVVRRRRIPLVAWIHGTLDRKSFIERLASRTQPDLVIANSRHTLTAARSVFPACTAEVVYFPFELSTVTEATRRAARLRIRTALNLDDETSVILQVSRMEPGKGHRTLLQALTKLPQDENWTALIVGGSQNAAESEYELAIRKAFAASQIADRVRFLGMRSDVADIMLASDVFCLTNDGPESFGIVFLEAMNAGIPVVTSNIGGAMEIVTTAFGRLVPPGDAAAFSQAVALYLNRRFDREAVAAAARNRVEELCNPLRQIARLERILQSLHGSPLADVSPKIVGSE